MSNTMPPIITASASTSFTFPSSTKTQKSIHTYLHTTTWIYTHIQNTRENEFIEFKKKNPECGRQQKDIQYVQETHEQIPSGDEESPLDLDLRPLPSVYAETERCTVPPVFMGINDEHPIIFLFMGSILISMGCYLWAILIIYLLHQEISGEFGK